MLRVGDMQRSVDFYTKVLGMKLLRTTDRPQQKYSLAFVGYDDEARAAVLELTYNYGSIATTSATRSVISRSACRTSRPPAIACARGRKGDAGARPGERRNERDRLRRGPRRLQDRVHRKARVVGGRDFRRAARVDAGGREVDIRQRVAQRLPARRKSAPHEIFVHSKRCGKAARVAPSRTRPLAGGGMRRATR